MAEVNACAPNAAIAFYYLTGRGFSSAQAAGIIGNLQYESPGLEPKIEVIDTDNLPHRGIAMWSPTRWNLLTAFAAGRDPWRLDVQLEFLVYELESYPSLGLQALLASTTVDEAVVAFQDKFERCLPEKCNTRRRIELAYAALSCLSVAPPTGKGRVGVVAASIGVLALVSAAGYGAYRALGFR